MKSRTASILRLELLLSYFLPSTTRPDDDPELQIEAASKFVPKSKKIGRQARPTH